MRQLFYLLTATILLAASCEKQDNNPAQFYIKCKVDGQTYLPNNCANCMRGQLLGDTVFLMNANVDYTTVLLGVTQKPNFVGGVYTLNSPSSGGAYKNSTTTNDRFDTDATHTGQLTITSLDKANKIIAGTFYFQAYNPVQNKTVNITNGEFRLKYTDY